MADLWTAYREHPTPALRSQLIEQYAPLAKYVVDRLNLQPSGGVSYDDLISQAIVGLIEAIDRYDPARGVKFNTFAYYRIRGAVMDMLRDMDWLPRSLRQRETDLTTAYTQLQGSLGRAPTDEQLARAMGISIEELDTIAQDLAFQAMHSLDEAVAGVRSSGGSQNIHGWEDAALIDSIPDLQAVSPQEQAERQAERNLLGQAIEALPDAERTVVSLYYYEGLTLKEIGRVMGVTESRACQVHGKAILRMRAHIAPMLALPG